MSIINQLASSLHRKDEVPNQELAKRIATKTDKEAVHELFELLQSKNKDIQHDAIKVIYEVGSLAPTLLIGYENILLALLQSKNNRLQWGAMTSLNTITELVPDQIYAALSHIILAADNGSVITNDQCVAILIKLCTISRYADDSFTLLIERLLKSPTNQLPMYAENAVPVVNAKNMSTFIKTLQLRVPEIEKDSKRARVEKVIKRVQKL